MRLAPTLLLLAFILSAALAAQPAGSRSADLLNEACPISGRPVVPSIPVVKHMDESIGFCCGGCRSAFEGWTDERKTEYVAAQRLRRTDRPTAAAPPASPPLLSKGWTTDLYTLTTCPITGGKLGSMGDPSVHIVGGREVRFCCPPCLPKFERAVEAGAEAGWVGIDRQMIKDQLPHYPVQTCIVTGHALGASPIDRIYRNRLVRFGSEGCEKTFAADPPRYLAVLDAAVIERQRPIYPTDRCIVSDRPLAGADVVEIIVANRLIQLCSADCVEKVKADPAGVLARLDEAKSAKWR